MTANRDAVHAAGSQEAGHPPVPRGSTAQRRGEALGDPLPGAPGQRPRGLVLDQRGDLRPGRARAARVLQQGAQGFEIVAPGRLVPSGRPGAAGPDWIVQSMADLLGRSWRAVFAPSQRDAAVVGKHCCVPIAS
jgi:hypothetical protein